MAYMYRYGITGLTSIEQTEWRPRKGSSVTDRSLPSLPRPATAVGWSHSSSQKQRASSAAYQLSLLTLPPAHSLPPPSSSVRHKTEEASSPNVDSHYQSPYLDPHQLFRQRQRHHTSTLPAVPRQQYYSEQDNNDDGHDFNNAQTVTKFARSGASARTISSSTVNYDNVQTTDRYTTASPAVGDTTAVAHHHYYRAMYEEDERVALDEDYGSSNRHSSVAPPTNGSAVHQLRVTQQNIGSGKHNKLASTLGSSNNIVTADGHHHYRFVQVGNNHSDSLIATAESLSGICDNGSSNNVSFFSTTIDNENLYGLSQRQQQQQQRDNSAAELVDEQRRMQQDSYNISSSTRGVSSSNNKVSSSNHKATEFQNNNETNKLILFPPIAAATTTTVVLNALTQPPPPPPLPPPPQSPLKILYARATQAAAVLPATLSSKSTPTLYQHQQQQPRLLVDEVFTNNNLHASYEQHNNRTNNKVIASVVTNTFTNYDDAGIVDDGAAAANAQIDDAVRRGEQQQNSVISLHKNCSTSSSSSSSVVIRVGLPQQQQVVVSTDLDALTDDCLSKEKSNFDRFDDSRRRTQGTTTPTNDKIAVVMHECDRNINQNRAPSLPPPRPPTLPIKTAKLLALQQKYKPAAVKSAVFDTSSNSGTQPPRISADPSSLVAIPPRARPHSQQRSAEYHRRRMTTTIDVEQLFRLAQQQQTLRTDVDRAKADSNGSAISVGESSSASTASTLTANCAQKPNQIADVGLPDNNEVYLIAGGSARKLNMPETTTTRMHHFESAQSSFVCSEESPTDNGKQQHGRPGGYWRRSEQFPPQQTTYAQSSISAQLLQDAATNSNNGATDAVFVAATNAVMMATRAAAVGHRFHSTNSARAYADTTNLPTVRRLVQLVEMHQYHEGVKLIAQMQQGHFSAIVLELPLDTWIAHYPKSLPLLDAVYARVASLDHNDQLVPDLRRRLHIQPLLFHIVKFYATHLHAKYPSVKQREPIRLYDMQAVDIDTRSLLRSLYKIDSRLTSFLKRKKKALEDALQSLGEHGLIHCIQEGEDLFYSLSDALRKELDRIITAAKVAVETADTVEPAMKPMKPATLTKKSLAKRVANRESLMHKRYGSSKRSSANGPSEQSHQHMLQLKYDEIQTRVKRNTRLLQTLHPIKQVQDMLNLLMSTLQRRINNDEVVLSQMSELKKGYQFDPHTNVADTLKMFIAGCDSVLYMLQTLNGGQPSSLYDKAETGSLVVSLNQESDQLSGSTSIASSANQLQKHQQSNSLRKATRMFGDSRANSYTAADFGTYFHNQSPSPPKTSLGVPSAEDAKLVSIAVTAGAPQHQQVVATRPQHLLYSAAASSSSSISPTPVANSSATDNVSSAQPSMSQQISTSKQQQPKSSESTPTSGVSSSSGTSGGGGSPCNNSSAGSSSSHSPVMALQNKSSHTINIYSSSSSSSTAVDPDTKKAAGAKPKPPGSGGDGTISEVSGYQSGHSSPVTSARSGDCSNGPFNNDTDSSSDVNSSRNKMNVSKKESGFHGNNVDEPSKTDNPTPSYSQQTKDDDPYSYNPFHRKSPSSASATNITVNGFAPPNNISAQNENNSSLPILSPSSRISPLPSVVHYTRLTGDTPAKASKIDERADIVDRGDHNSSRAIAAHREVRQQYERLYSYARDEVKRQLDLNDISSSTDENEELKDKLIFSVMVLAFRSVESSIAQARRAPSSTVVDTPANHSVIDDVQADALGVERSAYEPLVRRLESHDLQINIEIACYQPTQEIKTHLHLTLYDFPHLLSSAELAHFITRCVETVWSICVRTLYASRQESHTLSRSFAMSYHLDYDKSVFDEDLHCRAPGSDDMSKLIKNYMWPSLVVASSSCSKRSSTSHDEDNAAPLEDEQVAECIFKGIVLT